jgi:hypothetical protein
MRLHDAQSSTDRYAWLLVVLQDALRFCRHGISQCAAAVDSAQKAATLYLEHASNMLREKICKLLESIAKGIQQNAQRRGHIEATYAQPLGFRYESTGSGDVLAALCFSLTNPASTTSSARSSPSTSAPSSPSSTSSDPASPGSDSSSCSNAPPKKRSANYKGATLRLLQDAAVEYRHQRSEQGQLLGPFLT